MRKGLTQTLMAVAVVIMAAQAMAMAPTIGDIPSPVVGDLQGVTDANLFVYPDAFDLTKFGHDRETPQSQLKWTYEVVGEDPPANTYVINGATPLTGAEAAAGDLPTTPTAGHIIAGPGATNSDTGEPMDNNPNTITIRNKALSPVGGPNVAEPAGSGIIDAQTKQVVFYVTDLNMSTPSDPVWFYTSDGTDDYLSGAQQSVSDVDFHTTDGSFSFLNGAGSFISSNDTVNGMCLWVALTGGTPEDPAHNNGGEWDSPWGMLQLVKNSVYRIRCSISGDMTGDATPGQRTPLFDLQVMNFLWNNETQTFRGLWAYNGDSYYVDTTGGENATWSYVVNGTEWTTVAGTKTYDYWWAPPAVSTTQWNDTRETGMDIAGPGIWAEKSDGSLVYGAEKDGMIIWRIQDIEANPAIQAQNAQGTLCMNSMTIDRYDLDQIHVVSASPNGLYSPPMTLNANASTTTGALKFEGDATRTEVTTAGGGITLRPIGAGAGSLGNFIANISPGDHRAWTFDPPEGPNYSTSLYNPAFVGLQFPVPLQPQKVYQIQYELSAPTQADADNPVDGIFIGADMISNERIDISITTNGLYHHGMPNTTPQMFKGFFASNYGTRQAYPWANPTSWQSFRPRFQMGSNPSFNAQEQSTGAVKITKIRVDEVEFQAGP